MKKFMFLICGILSVNTVFAQNPQAPDKNPPITQNFATPQQSYATPQYAPRVVAVAQPYAVAQIAEPIVYQQTVVQRHCNNVGVNRFVGVNHFAAVNSFGAGNVSISAVDRRGTQVVANGVNRVRIERGLFGRIRGARAN